MNKEFIDDAEKNLFDVVKWWKREYKLSANSKEYLTTDEVKIYEDYYDYLLHEHNKEYGFSREALRIAQGKLSDPDFDRKEIEDFKHALQNIEIIEL